jgi:hypothetical protein
MKLIHERYRQNFKVNENFYLYQHVASIAWKGKSRRSIFGYLSSDGKQLFGTDGQSLHISRIEIEAGYYKVLICTRGEVLLHYEGAIIKEKHPFPNVETVIDPVLKKIKKIDPFIIRINSTLASESSAFCGIVRYLSPENGIDFDRIKNLQHKTYNVYDTGPYSPIYFEEKYDKKISGLIMPLKIK